MSLTVGFGTGDFPTGAGPFKRQWTFCQNAKLALPENQLSKSCWLKISQIRTISVERREKKLGALAPQQLDEAVNGLVELIS